MSGVSEPVLLPPRAFHHHPLDSRRPLKGVEGLPCHDHAPLSGIYPFDFNPILQTYNCRISPAHLSDFDDLGGADLSVSPVLVDVAAYKKVRVALFDEAAEGQQTRSSRRCR